MNTDPAEEAESGFFRNLLTHCAHSLVVELERELSFDINCVSASNSIIIQESNRDQELSN